MARRFQDSYHSDAPWARKRWKGALKVQQRAGREAPPWGPERDSSLASCRRPLELPASLPSSDASAPVTAAQRPMNAMADPAQYHSSTPITEKRGCLSQEARGKSISTPCSAGSALSQGQQGKQMSRTKQVYCPWCAQPTMRSGTSDAQDIPLYRHRSSSQRVSLEQRS